MGWIITLVIGGIVGSWLGFWLAGVLGFGAGSPVAGYIIAVI